MRELLFRIIRAGLAAGIIGAAMTAMAFASDPDQIYRQFLSQQMMIAKIKELNKDPTAESLKTSLAAEARDAGMAIPDWFYEKMHKPPIFRSSVQPPPVDSDIDRHIQNAAKQFGVNPALIKAVIRVESDFNTEAVSKAGAKGLMQIMDNTGAEIGLNDPFDPRANIYGGTRLLRTYLVRYQSLKKALIAYNAGEKYVNYPHARLPGETRNYIPNVIKYYLLYTRQYERKY